MQKKQQANTERLRIAIVNPDKCKPRKCGQECKKTCPVNRTGKQCIEVGASSKISFISEALCIGCGMCVRKCPFGAIQIINLPQGLEAEVTHRHGANGFKLHRLPVPRAGEVLGLVGASGTGKSTALKLLSGEATPNLGAFENPPDWAALLKHFRGSELQKFFQKMLKGEMKAAIKGQHVDQAAIDQAKVVVGPRLKELDELGMFDRAVEMLDLENILEREVGQLSGGELQRFSIAATCVQKADMYMFDEPSSYLDVKQRLNAARMIRSLLSPETYVVVVEHDLSILDYLSDYICCLYGQPGAYGVVTMPMSVRQGINVFLAGWIPSENLRFREFGLTFEVSEKPAEKDQPAKGKAEADNETEFHYPTMSNTLGDFKLAVEGGTFKPSEIIMLLGQNGTGKTTLIKMLAALLKPKLGVSYKPQTISAKFGGTVGELLYTKLGATCDSALFQTEVMKPLNIPALMDNTVKDLSGGELQRVALVVALGTPCDIYLIDEPSAYLDAEQRVGASKVIKRWVEMNNRSAFIVEHDFIMATYLADKVITFEGTPAKEAQASAPVDLITGMNKFLQMMDITFRRDPTNFRPRINKLNSVKDQEQKKSGNYFLADQGKPGKDSDDEDDGKHGGGAKAAKGSAGKGGKGGKKGKKDKDN